MFWLSFLECLLILSMFFWQPVLRGAEGFYGVRVNQEFYTGEGRNLLRQNRLALLVAFVLCSGLVVLLRGFPGQWRWAVPPVFMFALAMLSHYYFRQLVKPHRLVVEKAKTVASLQVRRLSDYTNMVVEILLLFLLVAPILLLIFFYPQLPDQIPVHWNVAMQPDRWLTKSAGVVALLPFTAFWSQGLILFIKISVLRAKMPLPAQHTAQYLAVKEQSIKMTMRFFDGMRLLLAVLFGCISLVIIFSSLPALKPLERLSALVIWACVPVFILGLIYFVVRARRLNDQLTALAGNSMPSADDDRGWYGSLFYYNPRDPALFVQKQIGIGYTLNFAHKQALYVMAYLVGGSLLILGWSLMGS